MNKLLADLPVGLKLALTPALVALGLCVVAATTIWSSSHTGAAVADLAEQGLPRIALAGSIKERAAHLNGMVMQSLAYEGIGLKAETIAALDKRIGPEFDAAAAELAKLRGRLAQAKSEALPLADAGDKALKSFQAAAKDVLDMKSMGLATAGTMMSRTESSYAELRKALGALADAELKRGDGVAQTAATTIRTTMAMTLALTAAAIAISALVTWLLARLIVTPLAEAVRVAKQVAAGNLSERPVRGGRDATGQVLDALGEVTTQLNQVVRGIHAAAHEIGTASAEIAQGNSDLSTRTEHTAASLQNTASTIEQLSGNVQANARTAVEASTLAGTAARIAEDGGTAVRQAVERMAAIHQQSRKIAEITGVIDGIAFQTNILALNAAVEAARAGEQGRGFAVVASEVRALAQRSAQAARDIKDLISASVQQIDEGSGIVQQAGNTMQRIVESVRSVSSMMEQISGAASAQSQELLSVQGAVGAMDQSTQQNAALVEEASAATMSLKQQVDGLVRAISVFRIA
jgi:methyl-accepting chemotaxis protein